MRMFTSVTSDNMVVRAEVCGKARDVKQYPERKKRCDHRWKKERRSELACHFWIVTNEAQPPPAANGLA
jgi:hypothetical protein